MYVMLIVRDDFNIQARKRQNERNLDICLQLSKTYIRYNFNREFLFHALVGSATSENKRKACDCWTGAKS